VVLGWIIVGIAAVAVAAAALVAALTRAEEDADENFGDKPVDGPVDPCPLKDKRITGAFYETEIRCGDTTKVRADGCNISPGANTIFDIYRVRDKKAMETVSGTMNSQEVRNLPWKARKPDDLLSNDEFEFKVAADGIDNTSTNKLKFKPWPSYARETKTIACSSGVYGWTGKFDISFSPDEITVTVKIKLTNRDGSKPASGDPMPDEADDPVSDADKATMKADIEGKLSRKIVLYRKDCVFGDACTCPIKIKVVVNFVESGEHHTVNLFTGAGQANATNWTRVKTRPNSYAHETGHLLGWYDEYSTGAVGTAPRWKNSNPSAVMNTGLDVPPEYGWDWRDWFAGKTGEDWVAKSP